ncbi:hypothetical protein MRX96_027271 [Rhipicephalus microplus]
MTSSMNCCFLKANVTPSQRTTAKPYDAWVFVQGDGSVSTAHCSCMAGLGEVCTHVVALLFNVELVVSSGFARSTTSQLCEWNNQFQESILLLAALGQSPLVTSAQLFVPFERDWRTGVCPVFDGPSLGDGLSAVFVAAPSLSAAIRFPAWQQGTASVVPTTSWGAHKRAHFDATSGLDAAMTQRHSPFALLQILLLAALGQSPLVTSAQLFVPFERDWRTGVCPFFDGPSFGDGLSAVFVAAPSLSAAIRFPAWQQGTASAVPPTSWGAHKRAHFDATSGLDAAMTQRHSPFALLQVSYFDVHGYRANDVCVIAVSWPPLLFFEACSRGCNVPLAPVITSW